MWQPVVVHPLFLSIWLERFEKHKVRPYPLGLGMDLPNQECQDKEYPDGEGSLKGLCKVLAQDQQVLTHALSSGRIMRWSSPKMVGVINFKTLAANFRVVEKTLRMWLPQTEVPKTILIEDAREQVGLAEFYI